MPQEPQHPERICRVVVTDVLSLHPYRELKRNCKLKVTHDELCTRHWNEVQAVKRRKREDQARRERWKFEHEQNNALRVARGATPLSESHNYYNEGTACACGHPRGDHMFSLCHHMFADHEECYYDMCHHCACRELRTGASRDTAGSPDAAGPST